MKNILVALLLIISSQALATFSDDRIDCNPLYRLDASDVLFRAYEEDFSTIEYSILGSIFELQIKGCANNYKVTSKVLTCGAKTLGTLTPKTVEDYVPSYVIKFNPSLRVRIVGSCDERKRLPETIIFE